MLQVNKINTYYGLSSILEEVSLQVGDGEAVTLLGRNGAGKTTTLRSIMGLTPPKDGSVFYNGEDVTAAQPFEVARKGIAFVSETRDIFSLLTARENLDIAARPGSRWTADMLLKRFPLLDKIKDQKGMHLSGGEQQMLSIARALMTGPQLLLLDEPSQGLAPILVEAVIEMIRELKQENVALLLVEQNVDLALRLTDRAYVLDNGAIVFEGTSKQLAKNEKVKTIHLGLG
ncbi:MAG: ABC transporter ATP-binding protein [SAR324 cluster bacterium]|nr:ABC transporter ATP-binding protein [SAR324 cluster bacterium]